MDFSFFTEQKHHAILLEHLLREEATKEITEHLSKKLLTYRLFEESLLEIETAKKISSWATTPYHKEKYAVISFHTASIPAQNALLKTLEEPKSGVSFIILTSNKKALVDTFLSRVMCVSSETRPPNKDALLFLQTKPKDRMELPHIQKLLNQEDREGRKDREAVRMYLLDLVLYISKNQEHKEGKAAHLVPHILEIATYMTSPSAGGKAVLEYLSLLLPQLKD